MAYYLYRHIRHDKDEPFYIGIAKKVPYSGEYSIRKEYKRAFSRNRKKIRNRLWIDIVSNTSYDVEIIAESDSEKFIKEKEVEFIKIYGKIHDNTGTLANITNGGDDRSVFSELGEKNIGKMPVYAYYLSGEYIGFFKSRKKAKIELGINTCITNVFKIGGLTSKYQLFENYMGESVPPKFLLDKRAGFPVIVRYKNQKNEIYFSSLLKASKHLGIPYSTLKCRLEKNGYCKDFTIKYVSK